MKKLIHNFIIVSTRPELLSKQIKAFVDIAGERQLKFYIFNDLYENNDQYFRVLSEFEEAPNVYIKYIDLKTQIDIIEKIGSEYAKKLGVLFDDVRNCFLENNRCQGIRSIQNKSVFIFYYLNKDKGSFLHKLDDDIFPCEADRNGSTIEIKIKGNFFKEKEEAVGNDEKIFSGSNYTIDSPSPLVNYVDFTEFIFNFLLIARKRKPSDIIRKDYPKISPSGAVDVIDKLNILNILPISPDNSYKNSLNQFEQYARLLLNGNSRVVLNDNLADNNGFNNFFPGGCVSCKYENFPEMTPLFGNQDLLWEIFEILAGKKIKTDGYIGHIKTPSNRKSIIEDLEDTSYKHQLRKTIAVFRYLEKNGKGLYCFRQSFLNPMLQWLSDSYYYSKTILNMMSDETNWFVKKSDKLKYKTMKMICSQFLSRYDNIKSNYFYEDKHVHKLISDYYHKNDIFMKLIKLARYDKHHNPCA